MKQWRKSEKRQFHGAELFAAENPELAADKNEEGRQRGATRADGQMEAKASVDQQITTQNLRHIHPSCHKKTWGITPEMQRYAAALLESSRCGRSWMERVAKCAAAIGQRPDDARTVITGLLTQPPAYPSEVDEVVAAVYSQQGGVE